MEDILIVDDQPHVRRRISRAMNEEGFRVSSISDAVSTWKHLEERRPGLVLINALSESFDSFELLVEIKRRHPGFPVLVYVIKAQDAVSRLKQTVTEVLEDIRRPTWGKRPALVDPGENSFAQTLGNQ